MQTFDRVRDKLAELRPRLEAELAVKPLSAMLRRETWSDHDRAQFSAFEMSLAEGTISKRGYRDLLVNIRPVYVALEERARELADDPIVAQFHIEELARAPFIERDLEHFYGGDDWREVPLLRGTARYVERVRQAGPVAFIAHHYTRYMADLSGGLMIAAALERAWGKDGLSYYDFSGIGDPVGFKNAYRQALNDLPLDVEGKIELIGEVMVAYDLNIEMGRALAERYLSVAS